VEVSEIAPKIPKSAEMLEMLQKENVSTLIQWKPLNADQTFFKVKICVHRTKANDPEFGFNTGREPTSRDWCIRMHIFHSSFGEYQLETEAFYFRYHCKNFTEEELSARKRKHTFEYMYSFLFQELWQQVIS
jgi:hypothetical protein